jgi:alpha-L-fucosidase
MLRQRTFWGRMIFLALFLLIPALQSAAAETPIPETKKEHDARMAWWRGARFGIFVHWGLYSAAAGQWNGKFIPPGCAEWIMNTANIPVGQYEPLAKKFNPRRYDPAAWAKAFQASGAKYVAITSKHHEGFCIFDTKATDYNIVKATPYGKDVLKPLAEACRKQGLKFCAYYSIMDWHHPAQFRGSEKGYNPTNIRPGRKAEYVAFMKRQLRELLDGVDPDLFWFDGEWLNWWTEDDGVGVYNDLRKLKPSLIINDRIGKAREGIGFGQHSKTDRRYVGDFGTPEQGIPATGLPGVDWEACMTMNDSWGYRTDDQHWKSTAVLVRNLIDCASKGGNYILNVGPTADGEIPRESIERLTEIGRWMGVNGEAIYGASASPFKKLGWGRCTQKPGKLYLHVFDWPADEKLLVPGLKNKVEKAYLLADPEKKLLAASPSADSVVVQLPVKAPDTIASVVVLEIQGPANVIQ